MAIEEFDLDSVATQDCHRCTILRDKTGKVSRTFVVFDSAMFLVDMDVVVQAVNVNGGGRLGMEGVWEVFDLVRNSFAVEDAEDTSDEY